MKLPDQCLQNTKIQDPTCSILTYSLSVLILLYLSHAHSRPLSAQFRPWDRGHFGQPVRLVAW